MDNLLLLLTGGDIPFPDAQLVIHQPRIEEIAFLGEENFYTGLEFLRFSKNSLTVEDEKNLENQTDFDILMLIMKEKNEFIEHSKVCVELVLNLMFPSYEVKLTNKSISFRQGDKVFEINNTNFNAFKNILNEMYCLKGKEDKDYNPVGKMSKKIADKFKKRQQKLAETKNNQKEKKLDILGKYISILSVGGNKDINTLKKYTVFQLFDEIQRYQLKSAYDSNISARLAGAKDLKEPENWMKSLYYEEEEKK